MSSPFAFDTVERLVSRIIAGEAVFFVGAGFSLDSEPNSSARLIRRLMARFAAITEHLEARAGKVGESPTVASAAPSLREGLRVTFNLGDKLQSKGMVADQTIKKLTQDYYKINDWICSSFTILLRELAKVDASVLAEIRRREAELLNQNVDGRPYDVVRLDGFDAEALLALGNDAGKSLFLETMGFGNADIWGGDPRAGGREEALNTYGERLRDRQHIIARLAREGLAPLVLTTNFDLLLEGACRAAGFEVDDARQTDPAKPSATYDRLLVVAGPTEFFERGTAYRAALLLKIHGCVYRYRQERKAGGLARYLPSMVFTFREIQNWRKDSWSRDVVSTLLRTRSIVLCGYSGADPVVHDTFRTVYEEILAHRPTPQSPAKLERGEYSSESASEKDAAEVRDTRAFFTGAAGQAEFAGLEILRAGSRAAGLTDPPLFGHPNYLPFHLRGEPGAPQLFPTLDELFVWIYHRTLRRLQRNAILSDLGRIAAMLLRRNVAPADVEEICSVFEEQCRDENDYARHWGESPGSRREFRQITVWTSHFHLALLREFALMETVARNQRSSLRIQEFRSSGYYCALLDRPGWGAWGAVVEMALRRMAARDDTHAAAAQSAYPVALVTSRGGEFTKTAVVLRGPSLYRLPHSDVPGVYRRVHEWQG